MRPLRRSTVMVEPGGAVQVVLGVGGGAGCWAEAATDARRRARTGKIGFMRWTFRCLVGGWLGFVLSQVSTSRPGAPMSVLCSASRECGLADAHFVSGPEGASSIVADDGFGIALDFDDGGGLVGGYEREVGKAEGGVVLGEGDGLAGF